MKTFVLAFAVSLSAGVAYAQPTLCSERATTHEEHWCNRGREVLDARTHPNAGTLEEAIGEAVQLGGRNWAAFLLYAQSKSELVTLQPVEDARADKQVGAPASGAGSSNAVSKGAVPSILAFAVENGALTQSTSGTTMTFRGNLVGVVDLLQNQGFVAAYEDDSRLVRQLRRVSYSFTLNTDTGASAAAAAPPPSGAAAITPQAIKDELNKTRQQLAGYSVRVAIVDQRDPRAASNRARIATFADTDLADLLQADQAFASYFTSTRYTKEWLPRTVARLSDLSAPLSEADIKRIIYEQLEEARLEMRKEVEEFDEMVAANLLAFDAYDKARLRLFEAIQKRPIVAFEYVNTRTRDVPDTSTFRLIVEGQFASRMDVTANIAWTRQNKGMVQLPVPTEVGGLRDFQAAAQLDVPLASAQKRLAGGSGIGVPVFGVAYLSQKLTERAAVTFQGNSFTVDPGWIHVVQAKLTIPVKGSGVKMPFSISFANRTELLKEKDIRAHVGVTFDMDVLTSLVKR